MLMQFHSFEDHLKVNKRSKKALRAFEMCLMFYANVWLTCIEVDDV